MSYILEALKKSEARRRLGRAPDLMEALPERARAPRRLRLALLGLLAVVVGGAAGIWLSSGKDPAPVATPTPPGETGQTLTPTATPSTATPTAAAEHPQAGTPVQDASAPGPEPGADTPPTLAGSEPAGRGNRAGRAPPGQAPGEGAAPEPASAPAPAAIDAGSRASDAEVSTRPDAAADAGPGTRESPLETLTAQAAERQRRRDAQTAEPEPSGPPPLEAMPYSYRSQLPPMALNVHVYAPRPEERFVLINMARYQEGDPVGGGGIWVVEITPEGAILEYAGREFLLKR